MLYQDLHTVIDWEHQLIISDTFITRKGQDKVLSLSINGSVHFKCVVLRKNNVGYIPQTKRPPSYTNDDNLQSFH